MDNKITLTEEQYIALQGRINSLKEIVNQLDKELKELVGNKETEKKPSKTQEMQKVAKMGKKQQMEYFGKKIIENHNKKFSQNKHNKGL